MVLNQTNQVKYTTTVKFPAQSCFTKTDLLTSNVALYCSKCFEIPHFLTLSFAPSLPTLLSPWGVVGSDREWGGPHAWTGGGVCMPRTRASTSKVLTFPSDLGFSPMFSFPLFFSNHISLSISPSIGSLLFTCFLSRCLLPVLR